MLCIMELGFIFYVALVRISIVMITAKSQIVVLLSLVGYASVSLLCCSVRTATVITPIYQFCYFNLACNFRKSLYENDMSKYR